jgi:hypothetical protein
MKKEKCPCCGKLAGYFHKHHILPKVLGGLDELSNIIKICEKCHEKIHGKNFTSLSKLIKKGIKRYREENGDRWGPLRKCADEEIKTLRRRKLSIRQIAKKLKISPTSVMRAIHG